jgi:hypothetical protein
MAINKAFVVKNGFEASTDLIVADAVTRRVGVGTTVATHTLHVNGGIGATTLVVSGIGTFTNELNVGSNGSVLTALGIGGSVGIGSTLPSYLLDVRSPVSTGQTALYVFGDVEITGITKANAVDFANLIVSGIATFNNVTLEGYVSAGNTFGKLNQILISTGVGVTWKDPGSLRTTTTFTANAAQTTFSVAYNLNAAVDVFINGVKLANTEFIATNGTTVILNDACFGDETIEIITYELDFPASFSGVTIREEGSPVGTNINTINFVGLAITATATGTASTISIDAQPPLNSDSQVIVGIITATSAIVGTHLGSGTTINSTGINVTGIITATDGFVSSNTTINSSGIDVTGIITATSAIVGTYLGSGTTINSTGINVTGIITATDGFVSTANTTPIQIQLVGNLLTFEAVGIGSTTFTLF